MFFFFQAEDGIRDLVRSRGLGDVYKRQNLNLFPSGRGSISYTSIPAPIITFVDKAIIKSSSVSYTHLTLPTNREV